MDPKFLTAYDHAYEIDRVAGKVYFRNHVSNIASMRVAIDGADVDSFEPLKGPWARDCQRVYHNDRNLHGCAISDDPAHFEILGHEFARDSTAVFSSATRLPADAKSARALAPGLLADAQHLYFCGQVVKGVHGGSFELLPEPFARDAAHIYRISHWRIEAFPASDPSFFESLGPKLARDRGQWYFDNVYAPRTEHDCCTKMPRKPEQLFKLTRKKLLGLAVRELHEHTAADVAESHLRPSRFDPRWFSRARILMQQGSLVVIFDQPMRYVPKGRAYIYARMTALYLNKYASGPLEHSANPSNHSAWANEIFVPTKEQRRIMERIESQLPQPIGKRTIVEVLEKEQGFLVQVCAPEFGVAYTCDPAGNGLSPIGSAPASSYPAGIEIAPHRR